MENQIRIRIKSNGQIYAETYGKQRKQIEDMDLWSKTTTHVES